MKVEFKYNEGVTVYHNNEGDPVLGDEVIVHVDEQEFKYIFVQSSIVGTRHELSPHYLFGKALIEIGRMIVKQAVVGKESTRIIDGNVTKTF